MKPINKSSEDNLTNNERSALNFFKERVENEEIILRPADKGNSIVIMNNNYYNETLINERHLKTQAYQEVDLNADNKVYKELKTLV